MAGSRQLYVKILQRFEQDLPALLRELEQEVATQSLESAKNRLHTMKGIVGTVGAENLQRLIEKMEEAIRNGDRLKYDDLYKRIVEASDHAIAASTKLRADLMVQA